MKNQENGFGFRVLVELKSKFLFDTHLPGRVSFLFEDNSSFLDYPQSHNHTKLFAYVSVLPPSPSIQSSAI